MILGVTALLLLRGRDRYRAVLSFTLAAAVFGAILAPWSIFASRTLDARVITTTTVPIVLANTFGDRDRVCFSPCDPVQDPGSTRGNIWFPPMEYSREVARATGRSEVEVEQQMWTYTRPSVSAGSYAHDVIGNFWRYAGIPASFTRLLTPASVDGGPVYWAIVTSTYLGWAILFLLGSSLLVTVVRRSTDQQVISLLTTLALGSLFTQPFVHVGTGAVLDHRRSLLGDRRGLLVDLLDARRGPPPVLQQSREHAAAHPGRRRTRWSTGWLTVSPISRRPSVPSSSWRPSLIPRALT